jgi:hypothetical protein
MYWLQSPPWGKWLLAVLLVAVGAWTEFRPDHTVEHPFAAERIERGEPIGPHNTEMRTIQSGLLEPVEAIGSATRTIETGTPLMADALGDPATFVPDEWLIVDVPMPTHVRFGNRVQLVLVETGEVVDGIVVKAPGGDAFGSTNGGIAVPPGSAPAAAMAALVGQVAVLISPG